MRKTTMKRLGLLATGAFLLGACDLDLTDPNQPDAQEIVTNAAGLRQFAIGLQARYSGAVVDPVYITGLVSNELGAIIPAFESYRLVDAGQPVANNLGPSTETWASQYRVIRDANLLLEHVPQVTWIHAGTPEGITSLAKLLKAMAFGNLLQTYQRVPLEVGVDDPNPQFASRQEGLNRVLQLLNEARQEIQATPPSAEFNQTVLAPGFDLANTIDAMIARYSLVVGDLDGAMQAAQRVDLNVLSEFRFGPNAPSSLWNMWLGSGNAFAMRPKARFRIEAEAGDQRVGYWVVQADEEGSFEPLDGFARYAAREASFPAYLPGEMRLIMAEVHARNGNLPAALELVNDVRTQCSSPLDEPVACLPALELADVPTQADMLAQILHERRYELFLQGVRWSDLRRFDQSMKYPFMMVSRAECDRNANAPAEVCADMTS